MEWRVFLLSTRFEIRAGYCRWANEAPAPQLRQSWRMSDVYESQRAVDRRWRDSADSAFMGASHNKTA